jgi:hypothetical protein
MVEQRLLLHAHWYCPSAHWEWLWAHWNWLQIAKEPVFHMKQKSHLASQCMKVLFAASFFVWWYVACLCIRL